MAENTPIEWSDDTLPIIAGCNYKSPGCKHCWAVKDSWRLAHSPHASVAALFQGVVAKTEKGELVWTGKTRLIPERIPPVLKKKRGRRIFVCSQSDLFDAPDWFIDLVVAAAALAPHHTLQILTKEAAKMRSYFERLAFAEEADLAKRMTNAVNYLLLRSGRTWGKLGSTSTRITTTSLVGGAREPNMLRSLPDGSLQRLVGWATEESFENVDRYLKVHGGHPPQDLGWTLKEWPLPNLHVGVTAENQETADERVDELVRAPVGMRWLSLEPLLGPVTLRPAWLHGTVGPHRPIDWAVVGGESGAKARPMHPDWARSLRDQCAAAGVPFLFKQWGNWIHEAQMLPDGSNVLDRYVLEEDGDASYIHDWPDGGGFSVRVPKKAAGRHLDGRLHTEFPR